MEKSEIRKLKAALNKAEQLESRLLSQMGEIAKIIQEITGVVGNVDLLAGDGFGFTPESNNDTHVGVDDIIKWAENGEESTEELILDRLSF